MIGRSHPLHEGAAGWQAIGLVALITSNDVARRQNVTACGEKDTTNFCSPFAAPCYSLGRILGYNGLLAFYDRMR
jgi:hypothetical protein